MDGQEKGMQPGLTLRERMREIKETFRYRGTDIWEEDRDRIKAELTKLVIENELNDCDRNLILLYVDCGSLRRLGRLLGCSHASVRTEINRIKETLTDRVELLLYELY